MEITAGPLQYADAKPTEKRLAIFRRLAQFKFDSRKAFEKWASEQNLTGDEFDPAKKAWAAAWSAGQVEQMFDLLRTATVLDESFRLPQLNAGTEAFQMTVEQKFENLMQRISLLTLVIQRDQENIPEVRDAILPASGSERSSEQ